MMTACPPEISPSLVLYSKPTSLSLVLHFRSGTCRVATACLAKMKSSSRAYRQRTQTQHGQQQSCNRVLDENEKPFTRRSIHRCASELITFRKVHPPRLLGSFVLRSNQRSCCASSVLRVLPSWAGALLLKFDSVQEFLIPQRIELY